LTASGAGNYTWSPALGLNTTTGAVVNASPSNTTVYVVTGSILVGGCTSTAAQTVTVSAPNPVTATATPAAICSGGTSQLNAVVAGPVPYCNPNMFGTNPCNWIESITTTGASVNITSPVDAGYNGTGVTLFTTGLTAVANSTFNLNVLAQGNCINFSFFSVWIDK